MDSDKTLGDVARLDRDNFNHVNNTECKVYKFQTERSAANFIGQSMEKAFRDLGVKIRGKDGKRMDRLMKSRGVQMEQRSYAQEEQDYISGKFFYKNGEIAYFISNPFQQESTIDLMPALYVKTNVKGVY